MCNDGAAMITSFQFKVKYYNILPSKWYAIMLTYKDKKYVLLKFSKLYVILQYMNTFFLQYNYLKCKAFCYY